MQKNFLLYSHHLNILGNIFNKLWDFLEGVDYKLEVISENCFSIKNEEKYLTVFPDGRLDFYAERCRDWEKIYILDIDSLKFIENVIKQNHFIDNYQLTIYKNKLHIQLGYDVITPSFFPSGFFNSTSHFSEYTTLQKTTRISRMKPLIYFCIYGGDEYYQCFDLAVKSLIEFGDYKGDILIKTDNIKKAKSYLGHYNNNFFYSEYNKELGIFNRYILNENILENYSSILYLDSDILTINPISKAIQNFSKKSDFCIYSEFTESEKEDCIKRKSPWFGLDLISDFSNIQKPHVLNSGFFMINNLEKIKPVFEKVINFKKFESKYGDQPFLNIALYNSQLQIKKIENDDVLSFARSKFELYNNLDKVFIHYNSGVGNLSKLDLMLHGYDFIKSLKNSTLEH